jgi:hypothetical protein
MPVRGGRVEMSEPLELLLAIENHIPWPRELMHCAGYATSCHWWATNPRGWELWVSGNATSVEYCSLIPDVVEDTQQEILEKLDVAWAGLLAEVSLREEVWLGV